MTQKMQVRYVAQVQTIANPRYQVAQRQVAAAEKEFLKVSGPLQSHESKCKAGSKIDCDAYNRLIYDFNSRKNTLDSAQSLLKYTPQTKRVNVYATHDYNVETHRFEATAIVAIGIGSAQVSVQKKLWFQDETQPAFAPAQLQADPLETPAPNWFEGQAMQFAIDKTRQMLRDEAYARAVKANQECAQAANDDDARLGCLAQAETGAGQGAIIVGGWLKHPPHRAGASREALRCSDLSAAAAFGLELGPPSALETPSLRAAIPLGATVTSVQAHSPAARTGLRTGDLLLQVSRGAVVDVEDAKRLLTLARQSQKQFPVVVFRDGSKRTLQATGILRQKRERIRDDDAWRFGSAIVAQNTVLGSIAGDKVAVLEFTNHAELATNALSLLAESVRSTALTSLDGTGAVVMSR